MQDLERDPTRVRKMFGRIARHYDLLNHLLSANLDRGWRRAAVRRIAGTGIERVLDLCGGTGDLALALARHGDVAEVVCCDFSHPMLLRAREKFSRAGLADRCRVLEGDGLRLPVRDGTFDAVTVGFGIRNFSCLDSGLAEIRRVLRPGGRMVVLEFSRPSGPVVSRLYRFYLHRLLPRLGDGVNRGEGAYRYLARTISGFPDAPALAERITRSGFQACEWFPLTGGIVAIHTALRTA